MSSIRHQYLAENKHFTYQCVEQDSLCDQLQMMMKNNDHAEKNVYF